MPKKLTTEKFIEKAKSIHGNKYDYSKVVYVNGIINVAIICPEHGKFEQTPTTHLKGCDCPKCAHQSFKYTIKEFIQKAKEVHGDKYDYSKVEYVNSLTKVTIICPEHGKIEQVPSTHLSGHGCSKCRDVVNFKKYRHNREQFIQKANAIHGDKYDYSKVEYVNAKTKVIIICPEHGEFKQSPNGHLRGYGCFKCAHQSFKYTTGEFIQKAKSIHGDKYDYSKVIYSSSKSKVIIICPEHGEFKQTPANHLKGRGCFKCGDSKLTTEEFILKAKAIHGDKYDYSKTIYTGGKNNVIIICAEHGEFLQTPNSHLLGCGCRKCLAIKKGNKRRFTTEEFIRKAKEVHGDKYDYSKVKYFNTKTPVIVICPEHGELLIRPVDFSRGIGCPYCGGNRIFNLMPFDDLKKLVRSLKIKTSHEYYKWWNYNKKYCKKNGIPFSPDRTYS